MVCNICNHAERPAIENALLCRSLGDATMTIESIAKEFNVNSRELQVHALMHIPVADLTGMPEDIDADKVSITSKLKLREASILEQTMNEYYATLKNLGAKINREVLSADFMASRGFAKNVVELYINCGVNIRETANSLVKMNIAVNGEGGSGADALGALVNAIRGSSPKADD